MSFSSEVKEELSRHLPTARHCQIAETAAILSLCGQISEKDGTIRIQTENAYVARKYFTLLKKTFNIEAELAVKLNQKENTYLIRVNDREETRQILQAVKLHETDRQLAMPIPAVVVQRQCCNAEGVAAFHNGTLTQEQYEEALQALGCVSRTEA